MRAEAFGVGIDVNVLSRFSLCASSLDTGSGSSSCITFLLRGLGAGDDWIEGSRNCGTAAFRFPSIVPL